MKIAFITGVTGQDGAYLSELLLSKNYMVHGLIRPVSVVTTKRIQHLMDNPRFVLHYGDVTDGLALVALLQQLRPHELYHLAAQSHVGISFKNPEYTAQADALGTLRILEALRIAGLGAHTRFYQASTSELFGKVQEVPQTEKTPFYPRSPYAVAKLYAYWITVNYRESYNMFACNGILFNHESPLRGDNFVTQKIVKTLVRIARGAHEILYLGNIEAQRDWGYAPDYVQAMWLMLQQPVAEDYVIATGSTTSVKQFAQKVAEQLNLNLHWQGEGLEARAFDRVTGKTIIAIDPELYRPAEVDLLIGDASKAYTQLGWRHTVTLDEMIALMIKAC